MCFSVFSRVLGDVLRLDLSTMDHGHRVVSVGGGGVQRQGLGRGDSWGGDRAGSCGCDH